MVAGWCPRTDELGKRLAHGNAEGHYVGDAREPSFAGWWHPKTALDHWSRQPWRVPEITWIKRDYRLTLLADDSVADALDEVAYHAVAVSGARSWKLVIRPGSHPENETDARPNRKPNRKNQRDHAAG